MTWFEVYSSTTGLLSIFATVWTKFWLQLDYSEHHWADTDDGDGNDDDRADTTSSDVDFAGRRRRRRRFVVRRQTLGGRRRRPSWATKQPRSVKNVSWSWNIRKVFNNKGGLDSTEVALLLLTQKPWVWFSAYPKIYVWNFSMLHWFIDGAHYS